jgi:hydrogenase expression/formation protein HypD
MRYISEFRDKKIVQKLSSEIKKVSRKKIKLMEVCGGHTMAIQKFGIESFLPSNIELLSGPGCPVCVTSKKFIDEAIAYSKLKDVIITTFGDLIRVPGSNSTLAKEKSIGADIRIVFSSLKALDIAIQNPSKKIIFLGIGFETTAPTSAATLIEAKRQNIKNFFIHSSHKIMPPAMQALITDGIKIDGFICPGHVCVITGSDIFKPIAENFRLGCVISGFEPTDILHSILLLVQQIEKKDPKVEIQYKRAVSNKGNIKAQKIMKEVFTSIDDWWRGFGTIEQSGLKPSESFSCYDAEKQFNINVPDPKIDNGCLCDEILKGLKRPNQCKLFSKTCTPENPIGACMVSNEGACQAYYKYKN